MTIGMSIAFTLLGLFALACVVAMVIRKLGRDNAAHEDTTSDGFDKRGHAITRIRQGDDVARVG